MPSDAQRASYPADRADTHEQVAARRPLRLSAGPGRGNGSRRNEEQSEMIAPPQTRTAAKACADAPALNELLGRNLLLHTLPLRNRTRHHTKDWMHRRSSNLKIAVIDRGASHLQLAQ